MAKKIQTVVFTKSDWTVDEAKKWLADHDMKHEKVDETAESYRFRQFDPSECKVNSFETLANNFPKGVVAVACDPAGKSGPEIDDPWDPSTVASNPKLLAMLMKRADVRQDDRVVFVRACDSVVVEKDAGDTGRLRFQITTDTEDRAGDVIEPGGWYFKHYEHNPIVLFNHDYGEVAGSPPSQGKTLAIEKFDHGLRATMEFHRKTRFNEELYQLYKGGYMSTTSVGFWPLERPEERETSRGGRGLLFKKQDMLEWSLVAVPMNAEAYQMAVGKGILRPRTREYLDSLTPNADRQHAGESRHEAAQVSERVESATTMLRASALRLRIAQRR